METKNQTIWDENNKVIKNFSVGVIEEKEAIEIIGQLKEIALAHPPGLICIDVSKTEKITSEARKIFSKDAENPWIHKIAFFGAPMVIRVVIKFIFMATGQDKKMQQFATEAEALKWLHGE